MNSRSNGGRSPQSGQAIVEYALLVAAVGVVITLLLYGFGVGLVDATAETVDGWL